MKGGEVRVADLLLESQYSLGRPQSRALVPTSRIPRPCLTRSVWWGRVPQPSKPSRWSE